MKADDPVHYSRRLRKAGWALETTKYDYNLGQVCKILMDKHLVKISRHNGRA